MGIFKVRWKGRSHEHFPIVLLSFQLNFARVPNIRFFFCNSPTFSTNTTKIIDRKSNKFECKPTEIVRCDKQQLPEHVKQPLNALIRVNLETKPANSTRNEPIAQYRPILRAFRTRSPLGRRWNLALAMRRAGPAPRSDVDDVRRRRRPLQRPHDGSGVRLQSDSLMLWSTEQDLLLLLCQRPLKVERPPGWMCWELFCVCMWTAVGYRAKHGPLNVWLGSFLFLSLK